MTIISRARSTTLAQPFRIRPEQAKPTISLEEWNTAEVEEALLDFLSNHLKVGSLRFRQKPAQILGGWESCLYRFQLARHPDIPKDYRAPLTLRVFSGPGGIAVARKEAAVLRHLQHLHFPVPVCLHCEEACHYLGGPFLLQVHLRGETILQKLLACPWRTWFWVREMADRQHRLHQLPVQDFPAPTGELLPQTQADIRKIIDRFDLRGLAAGHDWLVAHAPGAGGRSILHLDYHPLNLIWRPDRSVTVLDWTTAAVGDLHADVATTMVLLRCGPVEPANIWEKAVLALGRDLLVRLYLRAYWRRAKLDPRRLHYYQAWAALLRLTRYAHWLHAGPQITGAKPSLLTHLQPAHIQCLCEYFQQLTDVPIDLDMD